MIFKIAFKNLIGAGIRTWLNVFITSVSIFMILLLSGMYTGMMEHTKNITIATEIAEGAYWHPNYDPFDPITFKNAHDKTPESLKDIVQKNDAVEILVSQGTIYTDGRVLPIIMKGIDPNQDILDIPSNHLNDNGLDDTYPVLIGSRMANYSNLSVGDTFDIMWRDKHGTFDANIGKIIGIMDTGNFKIDMNHIWLPINQLQKMLDVENHATYVVLNTDIDNIDTSWIKRDIKYLVRDMQAVIDQDKPNSYVIYFILMFLASMGILNSQMLSIFKRTREIGTLMAIGMRKKTVVWLFTLEGGLHAILALLMTLVVFGPLLYYWGIYGIPIPIDHSTMGLIVADRLVPVYSFSLVLYTGLIVFFILLLVSYIPSRKIAKMTPCDAIRGKNNL